MQAIHFEQRGLPSSNKGRSSNHYLLFIFKAATKQASAYMVVLTLLCFPRLFYRCPLSRRYSCSYCASLPPTRRTSTLVTTQVSCLTCTVSAISLAPIATV